MIFLLLNPMHSIMIKSPTTIRVESRGAKFQVSRFKVSGDRDQLITWVGHQGVKLNTAAQLASQHSATTLALQIPNILNVTDLEVLLVPESVIIRGRQQATATGYTAASRFYCSIPLPRPIHPPSVNITLDQDRLTLTFPLAKPSFNQAARPVLHQITELLAQQFRYRCSQAAG
jgi:hypothetical protein